MVRYSIKNRFLLPCLALLVLLSGALAGCGSQGSGVEEHSQEMAMAPLEEMPAEVQDAPVAVQESYRFAAANQELMENIPCYCGCGAMGHKSNYACYFSGKDESGKLQFDSHALGCSICVDITQDAMRLQREGKGTAEIRSYVDSTYAQYGPSNIP